MRTATRGPLSGILGIPLPSVWIGPATESRFGDAAVLLFLVAQCLDGVLTYVGVATYGVSSEGNPILALLMRTIGHGAALVTSKTVAAALGIALHLAQVHLAVALLAAFYLIVAVLPWGVILFVG